MEQKLLDRGLSPDGFTVKYEDYLQSIEIVITPSAGATSDDFACIREAAGFEIITFEDGAMYAAYTDFVAELTRPETMARLKAQLKEAGLWEGFPAREDFGPLEDYLAALEVHAGLEPGSALRISGQGILFSPPFDERSDDDFVSRYSNVFAVVLYASTRGRLGFVFIGNEKVSQ